MYGERFELRGPREAGGKHARLAEELKKRALKAGLQSFVFNVI